MQITRVTPDQWSAVRDLRLRALLDSPEAFGGTYGASAARPDEWWQEWARTSAESNRQALFLAGDAGLAGAFHLDERGRWLVFTMWVDPAHRAKGIGRALLDAVVAFVREQGAHELYLSVTDGNGAARALYESYGFVDTGEREPLESHPELEVHELRMPL